ncbi:MAG: NAD(P)/FAD-dependent oxidoreductase [Patescibacteria group bacterium]
MKNTLTKEEYDVIVIGGGASGMMAAGRASELSKKVLILEKNRFLGEKLKITGGGRCNVTNAEEDIRVFLKNYKNADKFLYSPFAQFSQKETFAFFEKKGLPLVVQARKRAFPHTEKAMDVYRVMERYIKDSGVIVKTNSQVSKILKDKNKITGVKVGSITYTAKSYILATGGMSHPETGSTGDGFDWLRDLGHTVKAPTPTIVPLSVKEAWVKSMPGISLSFMKITFYLDGVKKFSKTGKLLFTHFGLSGPLILNSAGEVNDLMYEGIVTAKIDAYPDTNEGDLEKKIIKVFDENKNKMLKNVMDELVPHGTAPSILSLLKDLDGDIKVHSVTKENRKMLVALLKGLPLTITGLMGFDRAVVADGGVDLNEVDMKTMKSTILDNLYVTGDLLHINRPSGGFSLQICWTSGFIAGNNA